MITDFVKNGHAMLRCLECGSEHKIIKWVLVQGKNYPIIDHKGGRDELEAWITIHRLCKQTTEQLTIPI